MDALALRRELATTRIGEWLRSQMQPAFELLRDLRTLLQPGPRLVDQVEAVASVLLAIALAQLVGTQYVGWAAFSSYMVIRSNLDASAQRAVLRVLGTLCGAVAGFLVATRLEGHKAWIGISLFLGMSFPMYMALLSQRSYAWLFTGVTFSMVLVESTVPEATPLAIFAITRVADVVLGTSASLIVSYISSKALRPWFPGRSQPTNTPYCESLPAAVWHALQTGLAGAGLPLFSHWVAAPALVQAGITVMVLMFIPIGTPEDKQAGLVTRRMIQRFIGCGLGALLAMTILLTCHHNPILMMLGVSLGVAVGRHIENGPSRYGYIGIQFALAFLVVLVPDNYMLADVKPGMERILGILIGFSTLFVARLLFKRLKHLLPQRLESAVFD